MTDPGYGQAQPIGTPGQGQAYQGQPGGMPFMPPGTPNAKGFLASLFDTSFSTFVTPKVIKVVYVIVMIIIGLGTLGYIIFGFAAFKALGIIILPIALLIGLVYLALARMSFELIMVIFRMGDDMHALRNR